MSESLNLYKKIAEIRKLVEVIRKNKKGFNYSYVTEDEILAKVSAGMSKHNLLLMPTISPGTMSVTPIHYTKLKKAKNGDYVPEDVNEVLVKADFIFTWINCDNPDEQLSVSWSLVGQQSDAAQAFGSALTYANRYFMLKFFQIATPEDDPDNWLAKKKEAETEAEYAVTKSIIDKINEFVHSYLDANSNGEEYRQKVAAIVKKYVKGKNNKPSVDYINDLKDYNKAVKLLEELTANCVIEKKEEV